MIRDQLADILEIEPGSISESSSFAEDLNADSLALIELVEGLEEGLGYGDGGLRSAPRVLGSSTRTSRPFAPSVPPPAASSPNWGPADTAEEPAGLGGAE